VVGTPTETPANSCYEDATEALIEEARRRQRRRRRRGLLAAGVLAVVVVGGVLAARSGGGRPRPIHRAQPRPRPALLATGIGSTVLLWPVGYPLFGPNGGPPAYLENLQTGRRVLQGVPGIAAGDYQPLLLAVGSWVVYQGGCGVLAMPADLRGSPRTVACGGFFAASVTPNHVWLVRASATAQLGVQSAPVDGGRAGPLIRLPVGTQVVTGTDAGFLLEARNGDLEVWRPGDRPTTVASPPDANEGFGTSDRLVAYGARCRTHTATVGVSVPSGFDVCQILRVIDVVTGRRDSFATPRGTLGWVPEGFNLDGVIAPGNGAVAAEAAIAPARSGAVRFYVVRLGPTPRRPIAAPGSTAHLYAKTAWSPDGAWLMYQGPGGTLRALRVPTGTVRSFNTPCCQYTVMVALASSGR
jgi:hypothetical protein